MLEKQNQHIEPAISQILTLGQDQVKEKPAELQKAAEQTVGRGLGPGACQARADSGLGRDPPRLPSHHAAAWGALGH